MAFPRKPRENLLTGFNSTYPDISEVLKVSKRKGPLTPQQEHKAFMAKSRGYERAKIYGHSVFDQKGSKTPLVRTDVRPKGYLDTFPHMRSSLKAEEYLEKKHMNSGKVKFKNAASKVGVAALVSGAYLGITLGPLAYAHREEIKTYAKKHFKDFQNSKLADRGLLHRDSYYKRRLKSGKVIRVKKGRR